MKTTPRIAFAMLASVALTQGLLAQATTPPKPAPASSAAPTPTKAEVEDSSSIVELTPFEVAATKDTGYQATETLAGTRLRSDLKDLGSPIQVLTKEFLNDIGATNAGTLLEYTTNTEVSGTIGTYGGMGNATSVDETANLRAPQGAQRVRGLAAADNTRDYFVSDIPWDSYSADRIEILRGPNSFLFGLGSPAGIMNASMRTAEFRDVGSAEVRFGSYGSARGTLDVNKVLVPKTLALRFDGLWSSEKYRQEPAFQDDHRLYGALRWDPKLFKDPSFKTSFRAKYEWGDIKANRPRTTPPVDAITPWFRPVDNTSLNGGMGKLAINYAYDVGANTAAVNPWLTGGGIDRQQPIWFQDGTSNQLYRIYGGFVNTGARNAAGQPQGAGVALTGQRDSNEFFGIGNLSTFATNARLAGAQYGQFRNQSLLDPSVYNFNDLLIDGPNKKEWEKWNAYNLTFSQTGWGDRVGLEISYDRQDYNRGGQSLLGFSPNINFDMLKNFQDLTPNPNYGRPYIVGGPGNGSSYDSRREFWRASLYGELRTRDLTKNDFLIKLFGRHRFNGVASDESFDTEVREWRMYAHSREWDALWNRTDGSSHDFKDRPPVSVIYLGPSIANASSAAGAHIPNLAAPMTLANGNIYDFLSTWTNPPGVNFTDPWTVPANLLPMFDPTQATQQLSNPANYIGWNTSFAENLQRYNDGSDLSLLTKAQKSARSTRSYAGSWQGFMWNDAIVPTLGWRYDEVRSKAVSAFPVVTNRSALNLNGTGDAASRPYVLPGYSTPASALNSNQGNATFSDHSTAGGVVVHLNKLFAADKLPVNISLSYNKSNNFQVTDTRRDIFGKAIANPTGSTKDYGLLLSTKDGKYSLRVVKYDTQVKNGSTQVDLTGLSNTIQQGLKFRNVFVYRMSGYTYDTREQTNLSPGQRYFWTPAYINSAGRPVADLNGNPTPIPAGAMLETQAQADAHRDASIRAWNEIQKTLAAKGYFNAWGYVPTNDSALTDRATYEQTLPRNADGTFVAGGQPTNAAVVPQFSSVSSYTAIAPPGLSVTADQQSKGYEFELTANPTPNWRIAFNASETEAVRTNVGGKDLDDLVAYMDTQMAGVAGDMRQFNGNYVPSNEVRQNWVNWRGQYTLLKLQEGAAASELRKWRYNIVTNYRFSNETMLKGVGVGGSYRWQDKVVIGYPVLAGANGQASFDLSNPYYGPAENAVDLWTSYEHRITSRINWKIQLNIRNAFAKDGLIPISVEPDGHTWAAVRVKPNREWFVTNTFSF